MRTPALPGRILMLGCGSIGQALLPMLIRRFSDDVSRFTVLAADEDGRPFCERLGVSFRREPLNRENFRRVLGSLLRSGDLLVNVSVGVGSREVARFCSRRDILYVDTSIEVWDGAGQPNGADHLANSNYVMRESVLALKRELGESGTAVMDHGANPGLVSHFFKRALLDLAAREGIRSEPRTRNDWARLARRLDVRLVQIAERDSQRESTNKPADEFVNTWSVPGFTFELLQPAELGFGTHERWLPDDARRHAQGSRSGILLQRPGVETYVRSWVPSVGPQQGLLISHDETLSIADYFSVRDAGTTLYRPSVQFAYRPCAAAMRSIDEFREARFAPHARQRVLGSEIVAGMDELGVLVCGPAAGPYWLGSRLDIHHARALVESSNATSLQVAAGALAAVAWAIDNPRRGIVEPDEIDYRAALDVALPYLGACEGHFAEWSALDDFERADCHDETDPWQFVNLRVDAPERDWRAISAPLIRTAENRRG
ncbi:MAG: saccharopine dehydrogenase NADP-binding domain-containing protein [Steroidobacteraceae bacterium]